ncbi:MAG: DUF1761 domain-containing protein [Verrucomicrobia subdivision 3 bacterium]|nr:DUF1761 domain-containing protein [Limisphaerales bacterium]
MNTAFASLNWLSILGATLLYYMLGALWFSPVAFGRFYDKALGFERPPRWRPGAEFYLGPLVGCFLSAVATAILLHATGCSSQRDAAILGLVAGLGYAGAVSGVNAITPKTPKPFLYGAVTGLYHTVGITIVAITEYLWRGHAELILNGHLLMLADEYPA